MDKNRTKVSFLMNRKKWTHFLAATTENNSYASKALRQFIEDYNKNHLTKVKADG